MKIVVLLEPIHAEATKISVRRSGKSSWLDDPVKHDWSDADAVIVRAASVTREQIGRRAETERYQRLDRRQRH